MFGLGLIEIIILGVIALGVAITVAVLASRQRPD